MAGATPTNATGLALNGYQFCFVKIQDLSRFTFVDPNNRLICGGYGHKLERVTPGMQIFRLKVLLEPHPGELDILLPLIGYTEGSTDTFTPKSALDEFTTLIRRKSSTNVTHTYSNCVINKAIFRGQKGLHPVSVELDLFARGFSEGSTFSPSAITADAPYAFTMGALSLGGASRPFDSFAWVHDNHVQERWNNSVTATALQNVERTIHLGVNTPYTDDEDDLLTTFISSGREAGIAASLTYTNGGQSLAFAHTKVLWEGTPPSIGPKPAEVRMFQFYKAYENGANPEVTITQDATA